MHWTDLAIQTNFVSGGSLSGNELDAVINLANLCGIDKVAGVSTDRHPSGIAIEVKGAEKIEGRKALVDKLVIHRDGWERPRPSRSIGAFWIETSARPWQEERTIVQIADRTFRVGLMNGIKPTGADMILEAFVKGKLQYESDSAKGQVSRIDFSRSQPDQIGISGNGNCWITFSSAREQVIFKVNNDNVIIVGLGAFWRKYE